MLTSGVVVAVTVVETQSAADEELPGSTLGIAFQVVTEVVVSEVVVASVTFDGTWHNKHSGHTWAALNPVSLSMSLLQ